MQIAIYNNQRTPWMPQIKPGEPGIADLPEENGPPAVITHRVVNAGLRPVANISQVFRAKAQLAQIFQRAGGLPQDLEEDNSILVLQLVHFRCEKVRSRGRE